MSIFQKDMTTDLIRTPLSVAVVGSALSLSMVSMNARFLGLSAPISLGLAMGASSVVAGMMKQAVLDTALPNNESELIYNMSAPVLSGASSLGIVYVVAGGKMPVKVMGEMFALGFFSEIAGMYVSDNVLGPALSM